MHGEEPPRARYTISIGEKFDQEYFFKVYEYTLETGGDVNEVPTANLCSVVDKVFNREDKILEALRALKIKGEVSLPVRGLSVGVDVDNLQAALVELLYALKRFHELKTKRVEVLVKGYADGWHGPWKRSLKPGLYHYDKVFVYPAVKPGSLNPFEYYRRDEPIEIPAEYENKHLPDLRAQFVKKDLVEPFLRQCQSAKSGGVHVLKGYEFGRDVHDASKRKAQVFVNIY